MSKPFKCIGLIGLPRKADAFDTHKIIYQWLVSQGYQVLVEEDLKDLIHFDDIQFASLDQIGRHADLAIVIGGDGNMLRTARALSHHDIRIIGINRGNLGFLTDINPDTAIDQIGEVIKGNYIDDPRLLLEVTIYSQGKMIGSSFAVNEIVLHPSKVAHIVEFDAYINERSAFSQRADGLIVATPTGSTAYSLSAGGPIVSPQLDAIIITPMFPHSLSVRPLVIRSNNTILIKFPTTEQNIEVACDSQVILNAKPFDEVVIKRATHQFNLIHAKDYDYFRNLSTKLGWSKALF
ncbi:NAD(+) kinase [Orbaceae bacterium ac157xtp]